MIWILQVKGSEFDIMIWILQVKGSEFERMKQQLDEAKSQKQSLEEAKGWLERRLQELEVWWSDISVIKWGHRGQRLERRLQELEVWWSDKSIIY